ncbi:MAG: TlpA family protein disulfide reductase [Ferruginibacter sp.]|nr:TlpA family protein disulfide reductase [Chitinophagaceae bacterium]
MLKPGLIFLSLLIPPCCMLAQSNNSPVFTIPDSTSVTGKIEGYSINQEVQFIHYYVYDITGRQQKFTAPIQKNGKFSFRFLQQFEGDYGLQYGANNIKAYAQPGEKIEIEIDNNVADKVFHFPGAFKITGNSAVISRHILQFLALYLPKMDERGLDIKLTVDEFMDLQHQNLQHDLGLLDTYNNKNETPEKFRNWAKNWLTYKAACLILIKPFLGKAKASMTDSQMVSYLKNIEIANEKALDNASYYEFLSRFVGNLQMITTTNTVYHPREAPQESTHAITQALQTIDLYLPGLLREIAYYNNYSFNAYSEAATYKLEGIWNKFDTVINNNFIQLALETKRSSSLRTFTPYNIIERINKLRVDPLLKKNLVSLLEKEKGRYIYIDFWGSWCAPCMSEMPYYKAFIDELKDQPVTFLFLAVETTDKDIQKTQEKHAIPGTFISLNKNDTDIANEVFGFNGYPSHFFIDPAGNLVTKRLMGINNKKEAVDHIKWLMR